MLALYAAGPCWQCLYVSILYNYLCYLFFSPICVGFQTLRRDYARNGDTALHIYLFFLLLKKNMCSSILFLGKNSVRIEPRQARQECYHWVILPVDKWDTVCNMTYCCIHKQKESSKSIHSLFVTCSRIQLSGMQ